MCANTVVVHASLQQSEMEEENDAQMLNNLLKGQTLLRQNG